MFQIILIPKFSKYGNVSPALFSIEFLPEILLETIFICIKFNLRRVASRAETFEFSNSGVCNHPAIEHVR